MVALGYGVISAALPTFARTFGVSIKAVTFLVTVFSLSRLCFAPISGLLAQRLGERRIYIGGLLIVAGFSISGIVLLIAAVGWVVAPETRMMIDPAPDLLSSEADLDAA